jgi:type III secretory pathway component EscT
MSHKIPQIPMRTPKLPSFATVLGIIFMIIAFLLVYAMILFMLDPNSFVLKEINQVCRHLIEVTIPLYNVC